ncbi:hypothetical protein M5689_006632 [Euphorbia peplus]|nr:hypothetical protein M5689_006632 [Euphorbia peplus]
MASISRMEHVAASFLGHVVVSLSHRHVAIAFYATPPPPSTDHASTKIDEDVHTLTLQQPQENWRMDVGVSSNMMTDPSKLASYLNASTIC